MREIQFRSSFKIVYKHLKVLSTPPPLEPPQPNVLVKEVDFNHITYFAPNPPKFKDYTKIYIPLRNH